jgi:PAS domain S-box-containing protein
MEPIDEFDVLVDKRTLAAVKGTTDTAAIYRLIFIGFALAVMLSLWRLYAALRATLGGSVDQVRAHISRIGSGDFSATTVVKEGRQDSMLGWLVETQAKLNHSDAERRRTEAALREREERFQLVARATDDAIWDWDIAANTISFNESFGNLFGYRAGEFESTVQFRMNGIHPEDYDALTASLDAFLASGEESWWGEYRFRCADGAYAFVHDRGCVVRDAEGKARRMVGSMMNITERKEIEEALQRQQSELRALFDLMPAMIWFKDTANGLLRVNKRVAKAAGLRVDEIEGQSCEEIYPEQAAGFYADDLEVIGSGVPKLGIIETVSRPGDPTLWVQTDKVPYFDDAGKPIGIVVMAQDITERKREEAEREAISEIVQSVITTSNVDELLKVAHVAIGKVLYAENCFVGLHDPLTDLVSFEFWVDQCDALPAPMPISHAFTRSSHVLRTGRPLLLTHGREQELFGNVVLTKSGVPAASWLGVPLRTPTRTIGVLVVQHYEKKGRLHRARSPLPRSRRRSNRPRDRAQTRGSGTASRQGGGRGGDARQERVPGEHEPRDPHADERHSRHDGTDARYRAGP